MSSLKQQRPQQRASWAGSGNSGLLSSTKPDDSPVSLDAPLALQGEGSAGTWSRDPFTGCDREGAHKHADIRRIASRYGVTSIGKPTEPVPPSAGAGVRAGRCNAVT